MTTVTIPMPMRGFNENQRDINAVLDARELVRLEDGPDRRAPESKWPQWIQTAIAIVSVVVAIMLAYSALDKRISLMEQKLDFVIQRVK